MVLLPGCVFQHPIGFETVKQFAAYAYELLDTSSEISGKINRTVARFSKPVTVLIVASITAGIGSQVNFSLKDWFFYPAGASIICTMFLMIAAAFKKNCNQVKQIGQFEDSKVVRLSIQNIKSRPKDFDFRVTIHNKSQSKSENVHVHIEGLHDSDMYPSSGSRDINPNYSNDFRFPDSFVNIMKALNHRKNGKRVHPLGQTYMLTASSSTSDPVRQQIEICEDESSGMPTLRMV